MMRWMVPILLASQAFASAKEVVARFEPFKVSDGSLLSFIRPESPAGHPSDSAPNRQEALYLFDPTTHKRPHAIWKRSSPVAELTNRLSNNLFLLEHRQALFLADISKGEISPLLKKEDRSEVIHISDEHVLFLHQLLPDPIDSVQLGRTDQIEDKDWFRTKGQVYRMRIDGTGKAERLTDLTIAMVIEVEGKNIWAITAEESKRIVRIDDKGKVHEIAILGERLNLHAESTFTFNSTRTYLALSAQHEDQDLFEERTVFVCDLLKKKIAFKDPKAKVLNIYDSIVPPLLMGWLDENTISYGGYLQGERMYNLAKGEFLNEEERKRWMPQSLRSGKPDRVKMGAFEYEHGRLYFLGHQDPIADVLDGQVATGTIAISDRRDWAAYSSKRDFFLIHGAQKKKTKLLSGWCYDPHWLPSVETKK